jgi:phosphohistidine phosphatase
MDVYLVRHAIAHDRNASRWPDDHKRPLTGHGEKRFRGVARGLSHIVHNVDLVLSSSATRAWQTARILEEEANWPEPESCEALDPGRTPAAILKALSAHRAAESIAIVGHEPDLGKFVSYVLLGHRNGTLVQFRKGGVGCVRFPAEPKAGSASLRWLAHPALLRRLDD